MLWPRLLLKSVRLASPKFEIGMSRPVLISLIYPKLRLLLQFTQVKQDTPRFRVMYREGPEGAPYHSLCLEGIIDGPMSHGEVSSLFLYPIYSLSKFYRSLECFLNQPNSNWCLRSFCFMCSCGCWMGGANV